MPQGTPSLATLEQLLAEGYTEDEIFEAYRVRREQRQMAEAPSEARTPEGPALGRALTQSPLEAIRAFAVPASAGTPEQAPEMPPPPGFAEAFISPVGMAQAIARRQAARPGGPSLAAAVAEAALAPLTPDPSLVEGGRRLASAIQGEEAEPLPIPQPEGALGWLGELSGIAPVYRATIGEVVGSLAEEPDLPSAARRALGDTVQRISSLTPADIPLVAGLAGLGRRGARGAARWIERTAEGGEAAAREAADQAILQQARSIVSGDVARREAARRAAAMEAATPVRRQPVPGSRLVRERQGDPMAAVLRELLGPSEGPGIVELGTPITGQPAVTRGGAVPEILAARQVQRLAESGSTNPVVREARENIVDMVQDGFSREAAERAVLRGLSPADRKAVQGLLGAPEKAPRGGTAGQARTPRTGASAASGEVPLGGFPGVPSRGQQARQVAEALAPIAPQASRAVQAVPEAAPALQRAVSQGAIPEPADIGQAIQASTDLAAQVGNPNSPLRQGLNQTARVLDRGTRQLIKDAESGFVNTQLLLSLAGASGGALTGAATGEDLEDSVARAFSGALLGGLLGAGTPKALASAQRAFSQGGTLRSVEALDTARLLAGTAMIKASLGSMIGAPAAAITEAALTGNTRAVARGLRGLPRMADDFLKILTAPRAELNRIRGEVFPDLAEVFKQSQGGVADSIASFVSRPFVAGDFAGRRLLESMGVPREEAARYMLTGNATSELGEGLVKIMSKTALRRILVKFPRVRTQLLERGIEYSPLGLSEKASRAVRSAHGAPPLTQGQRRARAAIGTAALGGGLAVGQGEDPGFLGTGLLGAAAGPAALPLTLGIVAGKAARRGGSIDEMLGAMMGEVIRTSPTYMRENISGAVQQVPLLRGPAWQNEAAGAVIGALAGLSEPRQPPGEGQP